MASNKALTHFLQGYESSGDDIAPQDNSQDDFHVHIPLPPRLEDETFESPDAVIDFINNFAQDYGYAVCKQGSKRAKAGHIKTVRLKCSCGGKYKDCLPEDKRTRQGSTMKTECPFSIYLRLQEDDTWLIDIKEKRHNHNPLPVSTLSVHRQRQIQQFSTQIQMQLENGISTQRILSSLQQLDGDTLGIKHRDIYNFRRDMRDRFLNGREPIQAFLCSFPSSGDWIINYQTHENTITAVFFTHKSCLDLLCL